MMSSERSERPSNHEGVRTELGEDDATLLASRQNSGA